MEDGEEIHHLNIMMRVENEIYLVRDKDGSIINTDYAGYSAIVANKKKRMAALESMSAELLELRSIVNALMEERAAKHGTDRSCTQ